MLNKEKTRNNLFIGAVIPAGRGNGRLSVSASGLLDITSLTQSDAGAYICRATNTAGQAEKSVDLKIGCPAK